MEDEVLYKADMVKHLTLTKTGEWLHEGKVFSNQKLKNLFYRSIEWVEEEKMYYLRIGKGRASFKYEDTVYFVNSIKPSEEKWQAKLSDETEEELDLNSFEVGSEDQIYCSVKGTHKARLSRSAHQTFVEFVSGENQIEFAGKRYQIRAATPE